MNFHQMFTSLSDGRKLEKNDVFMENICNNIYIYIYIWLDREKRK